MKKLLLSTLISLGILNVFGQNDPNAKKILQDVAKKYKSYKSIQSDFELTITDANKKNYSDVGLMYFDKAKNRYSIILKDQEILSDGKSVWSIAKDINEIQISEAENNNNTIGPNNLFTFYEKGYNYALMDNETYKNKGVNESLKVIELSPIDTKTNYFKIKIRVNNNNHIHDVTIFDKSGNRFTYSIKSLYLGKSLSNNLFSFDKSKYPNYEIIDLR